MATVRKQISSAGTQFWQACWSIYDANGKRKRFTKAFQKQADAKAYAAKMEVEKEKTVFDPAKTTFDQLVTLVLETWDGKDTIADNTLSSYRRHLATLQRQIGHMPIARIGAMELERAFAVMKKSGGLSKRKKLKKGEDPGTRPLAPQTLLHVYRCGSGAFKLAKRWKLVAANPFEEIDAPRVIRKEICIMTDEEAARVYQRAVAATESGRFPGLDTIVALLTVCGLRRSEVAGLAADAIDWDAGTLTVKRVVLKGENGEPILRERPKTAKSQRTISIPPEVTAMLKGQLVMIKKAALEWGKGYRREPLFLFPDFGGEPMRPGKLTTQLRLLHHQARVVGVQPCHGFRHGMASALVAANVDVKTVASRLGHSTVAFTLATYVHQVDGKDKLAADGLGQQFSALRTKAEQP